MTVQRSQPDVLTLWRFLENTAEADEAREVETYLAHHPDGRVQLDRLARLVEQMEDAVIDPKFVISRDPTSDASCSSLETLVAYAEGAVEGGEKTQLEEHLRSCETCLREVIETHMIDVALATDVDSRLPAELKAQAEALWKQPVSQPIPRLIIQQVKEGLALVVEALAAPLIAVQQLSIPQPALRNSRSETMTAVISFRAEAEEAVIEGTVGRKGDERILTLQFFDADHNPLARQRVTISRYDQRYSDETDDEGVLEVSDIELDQGAYVVECAAIHTKFEIELP